jgi:predicted alpha/beta superfamily hydrolase
MQTYDYVVIYLNDGSIVEGIVTNINLAAVYVDTVRYMRDNVASFRVF